MLRPPAPPLSFIYVLLPPVNAYLVGTVLIAWSLTYSECDEKDVALTDISSPSVMESNGWALNLENSRTPGGGLAKWLQERRSKGEMDWMERS